MFFWGGKLSTFRSSMWQPYHQSDHSSHSSYHPWTGCSRNRCSIRHLCTYNVICMLVPYFTWTSFQDMILYIDCRSKQGFLNTLYVKKEKEWTLGNYSFHSSIHPIHPSIIKMDEWKNVYETDKKRIIERKNKLVLPISESF